MQGEEDSGLKDMNLHTRLDDIKRRVAVDGGSAGDNTEETGEGLWHRLIGCSITSVSAVLLLQAFHYEKTDRLICTLLKDSRSDAIVQS